MFTEERARWLYQHYRWLESNLPARNDGSAPQLILPAPEHFPFPNTRDAAFAERMFEAVRVFMNLSDWPCRLTPETDESRERARSMMEAGVLGPMETQGAAGTFSAHEVVEITYAPDLAHDPVGLTATFAHELCHYLLATIQTEPPCGWAEHEPLTDLAAVHEGFGVFLANSAFSFSQWTGTSTQGWQTSRRGYLTEAELGFSTAIFCVRRKIDPAQAGRFLKHNPGEVFWDALDFIEELDFETH